MNEASANSANSKWLQRLKNNTGNSALIETCDVST